MSQSAYLTQMHLFAHHLHAKKFLTFSPALMENTAFGGILFVMVILNVKMDQGTHLAFLSAQEVPNMFMDFFKKYRLFKSALYPGNFT